MIIFEVFVIFVTTNNVVYVTYSIPAFSNEDCAHLHKIICRIDGCIMVNSGPPEL